MYDQQQGKQQSRISSSRPADPCGDVVVNSRAAMDTGNQLLRMLAQLASFGLDAGAPTLLTSEPAA